MVVTADTVKYTLPDPVEVTVCDAAAIVANKAPEDESVMVVTVDGNAAVIFKPADPLKVMDVKAG